MIEGKKWVRTLQCADIPEREGRPFTVGERVIAIINLGDHFVAIDDRCPHMGAPLSDGIILGNLVVCPLHAYKVDLNTGRVTSPPNDVACNETFRTRVEDGAVFLEIPNGPRNPARGE